MKPLEAPAITALPAGTPESRAGPSSATQARSLFGEILDWMLAPLLLVWPMSIAATYLVAASIANVPFDRNLEAGVTVLAQLVKSDDGKTRLSLPLPARDLLRADDADRTYYQVLGTHGELVGGDAELPPPTEVESLAAGIVRFRSALVRGEEVRIAYTVLDARQSPTERAPLIQVAETLGKRAQLANEIIKGVILPQFLILPIAVVLVWFGLSRGLRPLARLQEKIQARGPNDRQAIDPRETPEEVAPLVESFNHLLARLDGNIQDQRRFIANAAHQMRTPLAGLRTQAELALRENDPIELKRSLQQLATSSIRATRLVNQLLSLARAENRSEAPLGQAVIDLGELARDVLRDWVPAALERRIDLGFEGTDAPVLVKGDPVLLRELLKNLLDNAIRYTQIEGAVTVRVSADPHANWARLEVLDNGPGIAEAERALVFERFYRILGSGSDGSGLGLAIVREIALQHRAQVFLSESPAPQDPKRPGTSITVQFPLDANAPGEAQR
jgi:two-component system sensor histidine kinase TctE